MILTLLNIDKNNEITNKNKNKPRNKQINHTHIHIHTFAYPFRARERHKEIKKSKKIHLLTKGCVNVNKKQLAKKRWSKKKNTEERSATNRQRQCCNRQFFSKIMPLKSDYSLVVVWLNDLPPPPISPRIYERAKKPQTFRSNRRTIQNSIMACERVNEYSSF